MKIKVDSRKIEPGDTFLALRGVHDGHDYIQDAIERGAKQVIVDHGVYQVDTFIVPDTRAYLIEYLKENILPEISHLKLIGMTGTNGKTTTCYLLHQALNDLGHKCAYIGTIGFYMGEKIQDLNNTTPDIWDLYALLLECKEANCEYVVMEVSSHSLEMKRVEGLTYEYAIFSNLTKDHLDYHKDFEHYASAKQKLFHKLNNLGKAIINVDDPYQEYFLLDENENITYGFLNGDYQIINYETQANESKFEVKYQGKIRSFVTTLVGKYNLANLLCVIIVLDQIGFSMENIQTEIHLLEAPRGRMEKIGSGTNTIVIDYAHTPDAVKNIITAMRELPHHRILTLIGCGGDRDKTKRPEMAKIATDLSDYVILTSDNPRTEDPHQIIEDMLQGLDNTNYEIEINRRKAIENAIQRLEKNDILLVLGKGHETYQVIGTEKIHFDDKQIVCENI